MHAIVNKHGDVVGARLCRNEAESDAADRDATHEHEGPHRVADAGASSRGHGALERRVRARKAPAKRKAKRKAKGKR